MLLTPQHRRSNRRRKPTQKVEEDMYSECPYEEGYEYNKDHYLASTRYSSFVDEEIAALRMQKKK